MVEELITARGSEGIVAMDPQKIIITTTSLVFDDSVIGIDADKSANELSKALQDALRERKKLHIRIKAGDVEDEIIAFGSFDMKFKDKKNIVITKTDFVDGATIGVRANKAARGLSRELVRELRIPDNLIEIYISVRE